MLLGLRCNASSSIAQRDRTAHLAGRAHHQFALRLGAVYMVCGNAYAQIDTESIRTLHSHNNKIESEIVRLQCVVRQ